MDKMNNQELVSALADGQLQGDDLEQGLMAATADGEGRRAWHAYHLVGDVLRSTDLAGGTPAQEFLARLRAGLHSEPAPAAGLIEPIRVLPAQAQVDVSAPAANDGQRWKLVAGFASLAAVAAIGWSVGGVSGERAGAPQLAVTQPVVPAVAPGVVATQVEQAPRMIRDERLDRLLAAHRQHGTATPLHTPGGFLRNATFEGPAR